MARLDPHSYTDLDQGKITHIDMKLNVDFESTRLEGNVELTLDDPVEGELDLDSSGLSIEQITGESGDSLSWKIHESEGFLGSKLSIVLPGNCHKIIIQYTTASDAIALQWLEPEQTAGKSHPYLFSQCQPIHARSMLPLQDSPEVRFSYNAEVTVPKGLNAVMSAAPGEQKDSANENVSVFQFAMPQPIPSYLFALAVGNLVSKDLGPRSKVYTEPEVIEAAAWEFAKVDSMLTSAEDLLGPYQWDRFDFIVMPPSFPYGGMENPRLTFLTPTLLSGDRSLVNVLAHELAHSWTGNLVTNATMNDFWLNEGFTIWAERRILERLEGKDAVALAAAIGFNGLMEDIHRFGSDSPYTHLKTDLEGINPDDVYSLVPYEKGYLLVHLIEEAVGREKFDWFIKEYIGAFAFTSITTSQFETFIEEKLPGILEKVQGEKWIHGPGLPENSPSSESDVLSKTQSLAAGWQAGERPEKEVATTWSPELWQIYLQGLPKKLSHEECEWLDTTFNFNEYKNVEILNSWLVIAANSAYEPSFERIDQLLGSMGRMKFLKPLYRALYDGESTRDLALEIFNKYADSYHPIARGGLEQILKIV